MSTATIEHLLNRYGTAISDILNLIYKDSDLSKELLPGSYYVRAEVLYAATHEGARSLVDVLVRRLRVAMESKNHGLDISQECAELIAPVLGWNKAEIKRQVLAFEKYVTLEMSAVN
jgi:glycerol-3-phosphate dehydrogenase